MRPTFLLAAATAATLAALPAAAQQTRTAQPGATEAARQLTAGGQYWVDPRTGCSYARAHVAGYAPTWHLIVNGAAIGLTNARGGCPAMIRSGG